MRYSRSVRWPSAALAPDVREAGAEHGQRRRDPARPRRHLGAAPADADSDPAPAEVQRNAREDLLPSLEPPAHAATIASIATVLVDAENVRRSVWPNLGRTQLTELAGAWAAANGHDVVVVWEGAATADDEIARRVQELEPPVWVVTSDRELRRRVEPYAEQILGGGSFARELQRL